MPPLRQEMGSASRDPSSEYQIIGNYAMGETIGKGSFGKVKKGRHLPTGENVAIKILNRKKLKSANMDKKVFREIKILKLFSHPNICRLYEVISTPTDMYLIMEYVEGGELYEYIVKKGMLKEDAGRYILQQIVCALEYCHHFLVVHRDLKPENILLGPGMQVKLIDFGLSNIMKDGEFLATSCGSPNYAAPEVISGKMYFGPEVDVWSCGVILYALLCGCLPFDEESVPLLFSKIKKGRYSIPSHVPPGARELIEQILVVDPLVRLTIPQIRDNAWFNTNLPIRLSYNESVFLVREKRISPTVASRAAKLLGMRDRDVRNEIEGGSGPGFVAYSILLDVERRKQIIAESESLAVDDETPDSSSSVATHVVKATERELNLGLMLTQSPAMEMLLDVGDATSNKRAYNGGNFLPVSVQETRTFNASMHTPGSNGAFSISKRPESLADVSNPFGSSFIGSGNSMHRPSVLGTSGRWGSGGALGASLSERQRVGSVAKSHMMYTQEEEEFIVKHNVGWRVGLMSDFNAATSLSVIYSILVSFSMEWKVLAPFSLLIRTTPSTWSKIGLSVTKSLTPLSLAVSEVPDNGAASEGAGEAEVPPRVILVLYLFRIHEKHDKGYLVDFSVVRGSFLALDVVLRLSAALIQRMG
ncbi:serine/threonine protein kinase [Trypanosoma grayi]|uniref:serine/threonine protein kinase n=1 Tax=Trypanosoma grayi TaxID=71804 RepID=UPI0004F4065B|nr:serine/threonine protein kinase [Trypanosoma grayi]KEG11751.1 serine/threonine protein kinase [Trypanosoma grayi]